MIVRTSSGHGLTRIAAGVVAFAVGLLLIAAAGDLWLLFDGAGDDPRPWVALGVMVAAGIAIGLRPSLLWARLVLALVFVGFTAFNLGQWSAGVADCGCFAWLRLPPWASAGIDLLVAAALIASDPWPVVAWCRRRAPAVAGAMALLVLVAGGVGVSRLLRPEAVLVAGDPAELRADAGPGEADAGPDESLDGATDRALGRPPAVAMPKAAGTGDSEEPPPLVTDEFLVLLVKQSCHRCRRLLDQLAVRGGALALPTGAELLVVDLEAPSAVVDPRWPRSWQERMREHSDLIAEIRSRHRGAEVPELLRWSGGTTWPADLRELGLGDH